MINATSISEMNYYLDYVEIVHAHGYSRRSILFCANYHSEDENVHSKRWTCKLPFFLAYCMLSHPAQAAARDRALIKVTV